MMKEPDFIFKVAIVGDGGVGKTSTVKRWSEGIFREQYQVTIGVQHTTRIVEVEETVVKLILWDMGGQDTFKHVRPIFYRSSRGLIIMFDLSQRVTFDNLPNWLEEAKASIGEKVPIVLVGNKADLVPHAVSVEEAKAFADQIGAEFITSSAKSGDNVGDIFTSIAALITNGHTSEQGGPQKPAVAAYSASF